MVTMILIYCLFFWQISINNILAIKKQNVLLVLVDDLRPLMDENVNLTNFRRLAANGITFQNAFAQQALCAPSRNSMLTGRRPDTLRLYDFYSYWRTFSGNFTTLPQFFKEHGYDTHSVGKVFHPGESSNFKDDYPYSWSHLPYHPSTEEYKDATVCKDRKTGHLEKDLICPVNVNRQPGKSLPDLQSLDYAVNILKRNRTKPFFLAVGFHKPHIPLKFPKEYLAKIPLEDVKLPAQPKKPEGLPLVAWHPWTDVRERDDISRLNISFPMGTMPRKWSLKIRRAYYAAAIYIDGLVGELLSHVDLRDTIVVVTSDHGWSLGENGLWAKYSNFDVALKVPLIFNIPNTRNELRKLTDTPIELIDIFPTLTELTGLPTIPKCQGVRDKSTLCCEGKSLVPLMKDDFHYSSRPFAISQYPRPGVYPEKNTDKPRLKDINIMGYSIRTKRYRYTTWISFNNKLFTRNWDKLYGEELYDHLIDPGESNNLNLNKQYKYIKIYLSKLLRSQIDPN